MNTALLDQLEAHLRALDWWETTPPSPQALRSQAPFGVDCLRFSQWLQWIYLPRARAHCRLHGRLPAPSALYPIASEAWKGCAEPVAPLLRLIAQIDAAANPHDEHSHRPQRV